MEYRGFGYAVARSISPTRWRWSVEHDSNKKVGLADSREEAIFRAQRFIDQLVRATTGPARLRNI